MLPSKKDRADETETLRRIALSPLRFYPCTKEEMKNAIIESEPVEERDTRDSQIIEVGIIDGFDFGDSLK